MPGQQVSGGGGTVVTGEQHRRGWVPLVWCVSQQFGRAVPSAFDSVVLDSCGRLLPCRCDIPCAAQFVPQSESRGRPASFPERRSARKRHVL
jgi:hypothetical protein